jgi:signal transduction histidine kinase
VEAVNDAINQIRVIGKSAFIMLRDSTSEFVYKDTYVFVLDTLGNVIVNLGTPGIEGQNLMDTRDPSGKYFVREMVRTVLDKCEGWVEYQWPKPGSTIPVRKYSFVKRIIYRGETFVVGTGIYLD